MDATSYSAVQLTEDIPCARAGCWIVLAPDGSTEILTDDEYRAGYQDSEQGPDVETPGTASDILNRVGIKRPKISRQWHYGLPPVAARVVAIAYILTKASPDQPILAPDIEAAMHPRERDDLPGILLKLTEADLIEIIPPMVAGKLQLTPAGLTVAKIIGTSPLDVQKSQKGPQL
jgi:hypothetical protein